NYDRCIEDFLGPEICEHRLVTNSKLTDDEKNELDSPLTIEEIDKSMDKANMRSAPGLDGISNVLLRKYWAYFRIGIHKYALRCFETGNLTDGFRGATIKLIPKKGDLSELKNWRPISLLSNVYKVLSRALNNRLNKIVNRVCSRAQKGFNDSRYT
ncbi:MAG: reverse transcriptase domain-containing protein, partial [bacterium]